MEIGIEMRRKTLCGGNSATLTKPVPVIRSDVPHLVNQNEEGVAVLNASLKSNHDMADVKQDVLKGNKNNDMDEGSKKSSHHYLDDDYKNFLGKKSCFSCNGGGELLVCAQRDCPINLHANYLCNEPKFDDKGNFYCPYCWYKRAWAKAQEFKKNAHLAKKDLSKFFFQNGITRAKLAENDAGVKTKPKDISVMGNESGLDYHNWSGNKSVHNHPLKTFHDQKKERERLMVGTDEHGTVVGDIANANDSEANTYDSKHYRKENTPVHAVVDNKSSNREEFDIPNNNISKTRETRFVEGQAGIKLEDLSNNDEHVHAMIVYDAKPLSAFCFGESTDGHLPDYVLSNGMQGVEVYDDKCRVKDREKLVQNELNPSATDCSVSKIGDLDSEPLPMKESHVKQERQGTSYTQGISSDVKTLPQKSRIGSKNACSKKEAANSEILWMPERSSMQSENLTLKTGKRKRLNWTVEEINMLKEGVFKFGSNKRNIPWKKILEFGCDVFHGQRNTSDMKHKWKHLKMSGNI